MSSTNQNKLDVIQKKAARIICGAPRDAHAQPLIEDLQLEALESKRRRRILHITTQILDGRCYPALVDLVSLVEDESPDITHLIEKQHRTVIGGRAFSVLAPRLYNLNQIKEMNKF